MINKMYKNILPSQIFMMLMMNLNSIVDSFFAGHFLNTEDLSSIGFYSPLSNIVYLCYVFITGAQILSCQQIGKGDKDSANKIFTVSLVTIIGYGVIMGLIFVFLGEPLASIVGATGENALSLVKYLRGLSFGLPFMMVECFFMCFLKLNDRGDLINVCMTSMIVVNIIMNAIFILVLDQGILGLAVASSITNIVVALIGCLGFISFGKKKLAIGIDFSKLDFAFLPSIIKNGSTQISFNVTVAINNMLINYVLIFAGGQNAVALMTVYNTINSVVGVLKSGTNDGEVTIGSIYFGRGDRENYVKSFMVGLKLQIIFLSAAYLLVFILAPSLSGIYFDRTDDLYSMSVIMMRLALLSYFPSLITTTFSESYQSQSKLKFCNIMSYIGTGLKLACMALVAYLVGINGIWLGMILAEALICVIGYIYVFIVKGKITFHFEDGLLLDDDFGVPEENVFDKKMVCIEDAVAASAELQEFCINHGMPKKSAYHAALCTEELTSNIFEYGNIHNTTVEVNFTAHKGTYNLQIMDNSKEFDPIAYLDQFNTDDATKNIGLKLVAKLSKEMNYQRFLGFNSLSISL